MSSEATVDRDHDHVVAFYRRDHDLVSSVATFLAGALDRGGIAVVIATPAHREAVEVALAVMGYPTDALTAGGRLRTLDAAEVLSEFMRDGQPDPDEFAAAIGAVFDDVTGADTPIRVFGEMVALLWDAGNVAAAIELESLWNKLAADHDFALYCAYAMSSLEQASDLAAAKQVCDRHTSVMSLTDGVDTADVLAAGAGDDVARLFVPAPEALHDVREFVREVLRAWNQDRLLVQAELIASELATNAVMHARSPFRVSLTRSPLAIRIAVRDASMDQPMQLTANATRGGGRGIALVAALAQTWETQVEPDGKTISATMPRDSAV